MYNKDSLIFISLFLVFFAGMGLLAAIIYELNIPMLLGIGALTGIIIGFLFDFLAKKRKNIAK